MSIIYKKYLTDKRLWIIVAAAIVRMGWLGFKYYPLLDDYIQYGLYPIANNPFVDIYLKIGNYVSRPLAGLFDIYIWGKLWGKMGVALFILTLLHSLSAYLFILSAEKLKNPLGLCFTVIFVLCPINFEGSYWISASSRLVVGVFLVALSCYMLTSGKNKLFFIIQLFSMLFYEQVIILSIVLSLFIILHKKDYKLVWLTLANTAIVGLYYIAFARMGSYGNRAMLKIINLDAVRDIIASWNMSWLYGGFVRGVFMAGVWYAFAILLIGVCFVQKRDCFKMKMVIVGFVVFMASYIPIVILQNYTVGLRNCFVPLIGVAIIIDALLNLTRLKPFITCLLAIFFLVISVSELADYKANYDMDKKIIEYVSDNLSNEKKNVVEGANRRNITSNFAFAEHILSIASSDWALTGAVREHFKNDSIPYIYLTNGDLKDYNLIKIFTNH